MSRHTCLGFRVRFLRCMVQLLRFGGCWVWVIWGIGSQNSTGQFLEYSVLGFRFVGGKSCFFVECFAPSSGSNPHFVQDALYMVVSLNRETPM